MKLSDPTPASVSYADRQDHSRISTSMRISIGILAWNEAQSIASTIESLFQQDLLKSGHNCVEAVEVVCVPNGCTDNTAEVARKAFHASQGPQAEMDVRCVVHELAFADKSNAWNMFVHELSDPSADYLFLMDADVHPRRANVLVSLLDELSRSPSAGVATPMFVKDTALKEGKGVFDQLQLAASRFNQQGPVPLTGGLYCARASALRTIWLPIGLLVEDGFLRAMIVTEQFTREEDPGRIVRVPAAQVVFEGHLSPTALYRHERRIALGTAVNTFLFGHLNAHKTATGCGEYIRQRNEKNPKWLAEVVETRVRDSRLWSVPRSLLLRRWNGLAKMPLLRALRSLPMGVAASLFDLPILLSVNRALRTGTFWRAW